MKKIKLAVYVVSLVFGIFNGQAIATQKAADPNHKDTNNEPHVSDASITNSVKTNIKKEPSLSGSAIEISTKDNIVIIIGIADSDSEASKIVEIAGSVKGVKEVDTSKLKVKESKKPFEDTLITAKVKGAFLREKLFGDEPIAAISISVETIDGVVYLGGTAQTAEQVQNAKKLAQKVKGVKGVESTIKLKPKEEGSKHNSNTKNKTH